MNIRLLTLSLGLGAILSVSAVADPMAVVVRTKGAVQIGPEGKTAPAKSGDILQTGWQLSTGTDGRVLIRFLADQSIAEIKPGSVIELSKRVREDDVTLRRVFIRAGEAAFGITPGKGKDLRFESATTVASVRGTQFKMKVDRDTTRLGVSEGVVRVCHSSIGKTVHVGAGSAVAVTDGGIRLTQGSYKDASDTAKVAAPGKHLLTVDFTSASGNKTLGIDWEGGTDNSVRKYDPALFELLNK
jgi:hypothetical protein